MASFLTVSSEYFSKRFLTSSRRICLSWLSLIGLMVVVVEVVVALVVVEVDEVVGLDEVVVVLEVEEVVGLVEVEEVVGLVEVVALVVVEVEEVVGLVEVVVALVVVEVEEVVGLDEVVEVEEVVGLVDVVALVVVEVEDVVGLEEVVDVEVEVELLFGLLEPKKKSNGLFSSKAFFPEPLTAEDFSVGGLFAISSLISSSGTKTLKFFWARGWRMIRYFLMNFNP